MDKADRPYSIYSPVWTGLAKVIEEAGEVIQVGGKIITAGGDTDWDNSDLAKRLQDELGDLLATVDFLIETNQDRLSRSAIAKRRDTKLNKFTKHGWPHPASSSETGTEDESPMTATYFEALSRQPRGFA